MAPAGGIRAPPGTCSSWLGKAIFKAAFIIKGYCTLLSIKHMLFVLIRIGRRFYSVLSTQTYIRHREIWKLMPVILQKTKYRHCIADKITHLNDSLMRICISHATKFIGIVVCSGLTALSTTFQSHHNGSLELNPF